MILEELDKVIQINWNFEEFYLKAIIKGLIKVQENEWENKKAYLLSFPRARDRWDLFNLCIILI